MDEQKVFLLGNSPTNSWQKTIYSGVQQFSSVVKIGEYEFSITKRLFVDLEPLCKMDGYLEIENKIYKILKIKEYSDYMEVWLYLLKRQTEVI